jgi:hypothetical protein
VVVKHFNVELYLRLESPCIYFVVLEIVCMYEMGSPSVAKAGFELLILFSFFFFFCSSGV